MGLFRQWWRRLWSQAPTFPSDVADDVPAPPFVGRQDLLADVGRLDFAAAVLFGDPGVGKSHVLAELPRHLADPNSVCCSNVVQLRFQPGSLQLGLLEALAQAVARYSSGESGLKKSGRIFAKAAESMTEERSKEAVKGAQAIVLGVIRARYGEEAAQALASAARHLKTAEEAELAGRIRAASDPAAVEAFSSLANELAALSGRRVVLLLDGAERLSEVDLRLLLDLVPRLGQHVCLLLSHSVGGPQDVQRIRTLRTLNKAATNPQTLSAYEIAPLSVTDVGEWLAAVRSEDDLQDLSADPFEIHRITGGLPFYIDLALKQLGRGSALTTLETGDAISSLVASNYAALSEEDQRATTLLAAFSDPPDAHDLRSLLGVDAIGWSVLQRRLIDGRILVSTVQGQPWMHELGRRTLWDSVFTLTQREASSEHALATIEAAVQRDSRASYIVGIDVVRLAAEAPQALLTSLRLSEVLAASRDEVAVLGSFIELSEESNRGAVDLLAVAEHARSRFGVEGDAADAVRSLVDSGLVLISENDHVAVVGAAWGSPMARLATIGRLAIEFDRLPVPALATAVFQGFLLPAVPRFRTARFGLGDPRLGDLSAHLHQGLKEGEGTITLARPPGAIVKARVGDLGLWGVLDFDTESDSRLALEALTTAAAGGWLAGEAFEIGASLSWPDRQGVADLRFTSAAELITGKNPRDASVLSGDPSGVDTYAEQSLLASRTWDVLRRLATEREQQILGLERPRGIAFAETDGALIWADLFGRAGATDLGAFPEASRDIDRIIELQRSAGLSGTERLGAVHFTTASPRRPVESILSDTHKIMAAYNRSQGATSQMEVPEDTEGLRGLLERSEHMRRADAESLIDAGLFQTDGRLLGRETFLIISLGRGSTDPFAPLMYSASFARPGDNRLSLAVVDRVDGPQSLRDSTFFARFFELPDDTPQSAGAGVLSTGLAQRLSRSSVRLPKDWQMAPWTA